MGIFSYLTPTFYFFAYFSHTTDIRKSPNFQMKYTYQISHSQLIIRHNEQQWKTSISRNPKWNRRPSLADAAYSAQLPREYQQRSTDLWFIADLPPLVHPRAVQRKLSRTGRKRCCEARAARYFISGTLKAFDRRHRPVSVEHGPVAVDFVGQIVSRKEGCHRVARDDGAPLRKIVFCLPLTATRLEPEPCNYSNARNLYPRHTAAR